MKQHQQHGTPRTLRPAIPVTDERFDYRDSVSTDVRITWRKAGWTPPKHSKKQACHGRT